MVYKISTRIGLVCAALTVTGCPADSPPTPAGPNEAVADEEDPATVDAHQHTNRLIHETSPYLLQHAHNPVQWYSWGPEAFQKAREEDKPIFLSVGYSTCYWCHVMERESFEKEDVAEILNKHFIAIKVDREERPDVDEYFMVATQLVTGRGGWPNSVWLTPDGQPWMAGTYFPRPQFKQILQQLVEIWQNKRPDVNQQADQLASAIQRAGSGGTLAAGKAVGPDLVEQAIQEMTASFDPQHGGFGTEPKFPPHGNLRLLIHEYRGNQDASLRQMVAKTLNAMLAGGIRDHLGGGFHRYSTDRRWLLPHFEKMLYDNAQLLRTFTDGYLLTDDQRYRQVVEEIFEWLQREMTSSGGAFYSAIDSESEQEEGKFYVWPHDEIVAVLGPEDGELFAEVYGVEPAGNYIEEATRERPGTNILYLPQPIDQLAEAKGIDAHRLRDRLVPMREKLLAVRNKREFPHLDDKVLTSWNALMIESLAYAGRELREPRYTEAATKAADFILEKMTDKGQLLRTYRAGQAKLHGYLDDYAFLTQAFLELYETTSDRRWLVESRRFADVLLTEFQDPEEGGFFFSTAEHSDILARSKNLLGGGNIPSANGVAAQVLLRLHAIESAPAYRDAARRTLDALAPLMWQSPSGSDSLVLAVAEASQRGLLSEDREAAPAESTTPGESDPPRGEPDARFKQPPVTGELFASELVVKPGQEFQVAVMLDIEAPWHLYGPNPNVDFIVESSVNLKDNPAVTLAKIKLPEGRRKHDDAFDRELLLYDGRVWFRLTLRASKDAKPGEATVEFEITTQACDDRRCLPPATTTVPLSLTIDATD